MKEIGFYVKLSWRFSGTKDEVTWLIASKFGLNKHLNNLRLLSRFHVAIAINRFCVISKSLKLRIYFFENGRVKTKEDATRASVDPTIDSLFRRLDTDARRKK